MDDRVVLNRRRHMRFSPELLDIAILSEPQSSSESLDDQAAFAGHNTGLILEQSYSGCSVLVKEGRRLKRRPEEEPGEEEGAFRYEKDTYYLIQAGRLAPLRAVLRWRREMEPGLVKIGFEFLE